MSKKKQILTIGISTAFAIGAAALLLALEKRRQKVEKQRQQIADEGYETAQDILYPLNRQQFRRSKAW